MKEITKRLIFGLRQSLQFIDPRGVRLLSRKAADVSNRGSVKPIGKFHVWNIHVLIMRSIGGYYYVLKYCRTSCQLYYMRFVSLV